MRYYLVAGEASGDLHGSNLIKGIKTQDPHAEFRCWGGNLMQEAGAVLVKHYKECAIMGLVEVLVHLNKIIRNLKDCKKDIVTYAPDVLILIDYPGFNFRIAEFAKKRGIRVFYYIAPKVWAWKESRVHKLKAYTDKLFIIFPFEIEYFKKWGIDAIYSGNPLLDSVDNYKYAQESREEFFQRTGISPHKPVIALLAGSRKGEINYLLPRMIQVAKRFPEHRFILAGAPSIDRTEYDSILQGSGVEIDILSGETYSILKHAEAAIISSGTASLEAALIQTPQVVCYGVNEITYRVAKFFVKLKYASLANLIMNRELFKELIQHECTPDKIAQELEQLLYNAPYRAQMITNYKEVRNILGNKGASEKVARAMIKELQINPTNR